MGSKTWELVSQHLSTTLDKTVTSQAERLELEHAVQSQGTTPATGSDQPQISPEEFAVLESKVEARYQAFMQEVDQMREAWDRSTQEHCKSVKSWAQGRLEHLDRQVKGFKSYALSIE